MKTFEVLVQIIGFVNISVKAENEEKAWTVVGCGKMPNLDNMYATEWEAVDITELLNNSA